MKCEICKRTLEQILDQDGEVEISSDEAFVCKYCKAIEEHRQWVKSMRIMFNVDKLEQENQALKDRWEKLYDWILEQKPISKGANAIFKKSELIEKMHELKKS